MKWMKSALSRLRFSREFLKFMASFLTALLFPVVIVTVVFNTSFIQIYRRDILRRNQMSLDMYQAKIDSFIANCTAISYQIPAADGFSVSQLSSYTTNYEKVIQLLRAYRIVQDFYSDVKFYSFCNREIIYTPSGTMNPAYYYQYGDEALTLTQLLEGKTEDFWVCTDVSTPNGEREKLLQYVVPVLGRDTDFLIFDINEEAFLDIGADPLIITAIYHDQALIYSDGALPPESQSNMELLVNRSLSTGIEYRRYIPTGVLMQEVKSVQQFFTYIMTGIVLLGGVLVYLLSSTRYRPVKQLGSLAKNIYPAIPSSISEFESIGFAIKQIWIQNEKYALEEKLKRLFYLIIYKQYNDSVNMLQLCGQAGLILEGKKWRVVIQITDRIQLMQSSAIDGICIQVLEADYEVYLLDDFSRNYRILILGTEEDHPPLLKERLTEIAEQISIRFQIRSGFFCGDCYDGIDGLSQSYNEAVLISGSKPRSPVQFYTAARRPESKPEVYPKIELEALHTAILKGDLEQISFFTNVLRERIISGSTSHFIRSRICHDIINTYFRAAEELALNPAFLQELHRIEEQAQSFSTADEYLYMIGELEKLFLRGLSQAEETAEPQENGEIKTYIDNCPDAGQLSVGAVAEHFGLSISNLSHRFKKQTGINISEYITAKRIDYAKQLLSETNLTLSEIAEQLGYCQTSSFMRVFKSCVGMTPGEYRRLRLRQR